MNILVRADVPTWAFARRLEAYHKYPPDGWTVFGRYDGQSVPKSVEFAGALLLDAQASYGAMAKYGCRLGKFLGSHAWIHPERTSDMRTRGVNATRCKGRLRDVCDGSGFIAVHNHAQAEAVCDVFSGKVVVTPYPVDTVVFSDKKRTQREKLVVGWCQQTSGGMNSFKGHADVLVHVIANVGNAVEWSVLTPDADTAMPTHEIAEWYQSLDIYLVTSSGEGGPHGPFEAAACGAAVIATDVGQMSDWSDLAAVDMRVPTYASSAEAKVVASEMADRILSLSKDRTRLDRVATSLRTSIDENFSAQKISPLQLREMFCV